MMTQTVYRKTLGELYADLPTNGLFSASSNNAYANFINSIRDVVDLKDSQGINYTTSAVDSYIVSNYRDLELKEYWTRPNAAISTHVQFTVGAVLGANMYEYQKMLDTLTMEIDPLNMTDYTKTITKEFGLHIIDNEIGQKRSTDVNGAVNVTDTIGSHTDTKRNYATTMDNTASSSEKLKEKEETVVGTHSDTHNTGTYTDTHTHDSSKDTKTDKAHTDTVTETITGNVDKDEMDLIQKYRDMAKFSLVKRIARDLAYGFCVRTYNLGDFSHWRG